MIFRFLSIYISCVKKIVEKYKSLVGEYAAENGISAQVRPFDTPALLLAFESENECADIYILDIIMPEMNGVQLGKEIRKRNAEAFIIFLTTSKDYALESYSVKAFAYIIKPAKKEDVTVSLRAAFPAKKALRAVPSEMRFGNNRRKSRRYRFH